MSARILVVDDEASMREFLEIALSRMGHEVTVVDDGAQAIEHLSRDTYDVVLSDIRMPEGLDGIGLLEQVREISPATQVILMTAYASVDTAIRAVQLGASDYLTKPFKIEEIKHRISMAIEKRRLVTENRYLRDRTEETEGTPEILGESAQIEAVREMIARVAPTGSTVLVTGESGTGKELVARAVHRASERRDAAFVSVNCGAIPEGLLESELFGHKKGSFTGAVRDREGLFQVADAGTLFLDEIGETTPAIQVKLLRALQEREVVPVGGTHPVKVDVRVIAATNASLEERVSAGTFREDLFYRLNVVPIHMPALRDRCQDVPLLARHFLDRFSHGGKRFSDDALRLLQAYEWPGNVRELENAVERAVIMTTADVIDPDALPDRLSTPTAERVGAIPERSATPTLEIIEKAYIAWVLQQTGGVKTAAAEVLGIDPSTLHRKMDRYGMREDPDE